MIVAFPSFRRGRKGFGQPSLEIDESKNLSEKGSDPGRRGSDSSSDRFLGVRRQLESKSEGNLSMKSRSVLCPIDFDSASLAALPLAIQQAQSRDAVLDLLHVWQPGREYAPEGPPIPFAEGIPEQRIKQDLASLPIDLPTERVRLHVTGGKPGQDIIDLATSLDSELVVMGTHARHGLSRWMVGSVCEWVLHHCPCPILVCRGPEPN